jgi:predicted nucleic acid-binding protein
MAQVALRKCRDCPAEAAALVMRAYETSLRVSVELLDPSWPEIVRLARAHDLSAYDASYLQLALALHLPLATLDKRLGQVADKLGLRAIPAAVG